MGQNDSVSLSKFFIVAAGVVIWLCVTSHHTYRQILDSLQLAGGCFWSAVQQAVAVSQSEHHCSADCWLSQSTWSLLLHACLLAMLAGCDERRQTERTNGIEYLTGWHDSHQEACMNRHACLDLQMNERCTSLHRAAGCNGFVITVATACCWSIHECTGQQQHPDQIDDRDRFTGYLLSTIMTATVAHRAYPLQTRRTTSVRNIQSVLAIHNKCKSLRSS